MVKKKILKDQSQVNKLGYVNFKTRKKNERETGNPAQLYIEKSAPGVTILIINQLKRSY